MPLNLASPGIVIREVDLTVGRVEPLSGAVGAIAAPFAQGPVDLPQLIESENDLLQTFGQPYATDKHYEHWMVASSYLAYGGTIRVNRADDAGLKNAFVGTANSIKIKSDEHYNQLGYDESTIAGVTFAARNPGSWANGVKVAYIDAFADQTLTGIDPAVISVGYGFTVAHTKVSSTSTGVSTSVGYLKGVVVGKSGITTAGGTCDIKITSFVPNGGSETAVDYNAANKVASSATISFHNSSESVAVTTAYTGVRDWFDNQSITLSNSTVAWNTLANRPTTSAYAEARSSRFDEIHVVVIDDTGTITGNAGTILEKHLNLSKASDAEFSVGSTSYWRKYLLANSQYVYGGGAPAGITTTGFATNGANAFSLASDIGWDQESQGIIFAGAGSSTATLANGTNYGGTIGLTTSGSLYSGIDGIISGYTVFENTENYEVDFILMGSANYGVNDARAVAAKCIQVAETRKDAIAFISPYRQAFLNDTAVGTALVNSEDQITENVIDFYAPLTSSSYAVFDSGYKYMYDRFNNTFRYIPLNGDIAGTCARNDINQFPWYSPAGTARGTILNAVKLAYNPGKVQRDKLYSNRINPVIFSPGSGIILFGDKTGFAKASAFDRINVRRLFIYLEDAIAAAARDQLFEFNDEITRTNFVNIVEPFLRDVQAKRGIFDYIVVCDESNNTAAVIDNNEFIADIYIKPARSINFIGLTFVATRTGVAFEEVIGSF